MRSLPRISLSAHGLVELLAGLALTVAPLVLDLGGVGTVLVFATGVALAGVGLGATDALSLSAHQSLDRTIVIAVAAAAVGAAAAGSTLAASLLLVAATTVLLLEATTRWSRPLAR
jgi:hypothetical protein